MLKAFAGGRLFGATAGSGPPWVLALHGWGRTHADFTPLLDGLDGIAVDLPGFGASPEPPAVWGAHEYAHAVAPLLDELAGDAVVVGHSRGGCIAVALAADYPDRIRALVITGAPLLRSPAPPPSLPYRAVRLAHRLGIVSDQRMEGRRQRSGGIDYRNARGIMRDVLVKMTNESHEKELEALQAPLEMVWGEHDTAAPLDLARRAAALTPDASLVVVPGDHFAPLRAAELRAAVERHAP